MMHHDSAINNPILLGSIPMNSLGNSTPATLSVLNSESLLADIQPFRPDWNQLEADSGGGNTGLIIAAGLFFSAAMVLAVVLHRRSRTRKSTTDTVNSDKEVLQVNKSAQSSEG